MAMRIKLDLDTLAYEQIFEKICKVRCKGLQQSPSEWIFIVPMNKAGKAIGTNAQNIKKLQQSLSYRNNNLSKLKIKIVEFHPNIKIFIKNLISPIQVEQIQVQDNYVQITDSSKKTKSLLIGPGASKIKLLNSIIQRFFHKTLKIK